MKFIRANLLTLTVITGLMVSLSVPHIYRYLSLGLKYTTLIIDGPAVTPLSWEETYTYATEANRIKNNQLINDPYIYEYSKKPSPLVSETFPSIIVGLPAKAISIPTVFIFMKVLILPLTVLVWYLIARQIGYSKIVSVSAALSSIIIQKLFVYIPYIPKFYDYELNGLLESQRIYFPLISSFITALTILFILKLLSNQQKIRYIILSGLFLGSLFFTYFFAWTLIIPSYVLFLTVLIILDKRKQVKPLLVSLALGFLISLPYFINLYLFYLNPASQDFILRTISFPITDWNIPIIFRFLAFLILLVIVNKQWLKSSSKRFLLVIFLTAALLPLASKIIFQTDNQTDHWHERFLYPLSTFLLVLCISEVKQLNFKIKKLVLLLLIIFSLLKLDISMYREVEKQSNLFTIGSQRSDLYGWMMKNISKNSVVATLSFTESVYLTAYTPYYSYLPQAYKTIAPKQEILNRYVNLVQLFGVNSSFITQPFIMPDEPYLNPNSIVAKDGNAYMMLTGIVGHFDAFPYPYHKEIQSQIITKLSQTVPLQGKIDYLLFGPLERENAASFSQRKCRLLYSNGQYQLFDFKTCKSIS